MVLEATHHLICRVDLGAVLQQQLHHRLVTTKSSPHARCKVLLRDGGVKPGRICKRWLSLQTDSLCAIIVSVTNIFKERSEQEQKEKACP